MYPRMQLVPTIRSSNTCLLASCLVWNYGEGGKGGEKKEISMEISCLQSLWR